MRTAKSFTAHAGFAVLVALVAQCATSFAASRDEKAIDPIIAGAPTTETGVWRSKTQSVFDPTAHSLLRRSYTVWDANPSRALDFTWIPISFGDDTEGKITGRGRLVWRYKGKPAYDSSSLFSEYRGTMKDGRSEGEGSYFDATGLSYQGGWKNGLMDGPGTLLLPSGDEYIGQMRAGKANGAGRYIDPTGEVFEGNFVDGEREGLGTTTLPNGNSYRSTWLHGEETKDSRLLRVAQSQGQALPGSADDVRIGITIDKSKARKVDNTPDTTPDLTYSASSNGAQLTIQPDNKRIMQLWKGDGEIQLTDNEEQNLIADGVLGLSQGMLLPLTLVFQVQNRSTAPISVSGAYFNVERSVSDLQPALQLRRDADACEIHVAPFKPTFTVENFGWGAAQRAQMHFAFANPNTSGKPTTLNLSKSLGNIAKTSDVDLTPELRAAGVNTGALEAKSPTGFDCRSSSVSACLQQIKATGVFGSIGSQVGLQDNNIFVNATGTLDYEWQDSKGETHTRSSPYRVKLPLGHIKMQAECGEGGERDVVAAKPLHFRLDQTGYRLPISFTRAIPAGQTSQFTVTVDAEKSSQHDFTFTLQLSDGREIPSRPVSLLYYVPSWIRSN
jgi:hypothetical protein